VGTTEHQVQLLTELDPEELLDSDALLDGPIGSLEPADLDEPALPGVPEEPEALLAPVAALPSRSTARAAGRHARTADTALAGSLLSAQTWRQAYAAATGRVQDAS
jgi:flagellar protein FliO/FliZ